MALSPGPCNGLFWLPAWGLSQEGVMASPALPGVSVGFWTGSANPSKALLGVEVEARSWPNSTLDALPR